ncbi:DUF5606 domain-containing protein [Compostibacter hankyongensis]|uniref:DUF5606 domain-containing protein n=1 Tax=Compostibacter hankyongensis TaxID=1007089 RepID=A0ABP8FDR1_9BACT
MQYREIVSVTGLGGLYQLLSSKPEGAIIRSLEDQSTRFAAARQYNFTPLESIEVFTSGENVNLSDIFKAMQAAEAEHPPVDAKADGPAIRDYFKTVYPELDEERVYMSDMKKMLKWYTLLKVRDLLHFEEAKTEEKAPAAEAAEATETQEEAPAAEPAKKPARKTAKPAAKKAAEADAPAKKAGTRKKKEA